MKWILLIEIAITFACFFLAWKADHGGSRDEAIGAIFPLFVGGAMTCVTIVTGIGWAVWVIAT